MLAKLTDRIRQSLIDDDHRYRFQIILLPLLLSFISLTMTAVNYLTGEHNLMFATLIFGLLSLMCSIMSALRPTMTTVSYVLFNILFLVMSMTFLITGSADGFSPLWMLLLPACGIIFSGLKMGSVFCAALFAMLVFFMWTPCGQGMLQYNYTETFLIRFPLLYAACFFVGLFFELTRKITYDSLKQTQQELWQLSMHDGMTGICNRTKFTQDIDQMVGDDTEHTAGFIYVDINGLKHTNDTRSHDIGDSMINSCVGIMTARFSKDDCYRLGGDEFLVILRDCTQEILDKQFERLTNDFTAVDTVSVSLGKAFADSRQKLRSAITEADADMQQSKRQYYISTGIDRRR